MKRAVDAKGTLRTVQELYITFFIQRECIEKPYARDKYLKQPADTLYFIAFDLLNVGLISDPTDQRPLLVTDAEALRLSP